MRARVVIVVVGLAAAAAPAPGAAAPCPGAVGCELWSTRISGEGQAYAEGAALSPDGRHLAVTGRIDVPAADPTTPVSPRTRAAALVAGVAAGDGKRIWQSFHSHPFIRDPGSDGFVNVVHSPDGRTIYAVGTYGKDGDRTDSDVLIAAYDAATGAQRWARSIDGPAHERDIGSTIAVDPDGRRLAAAGFVCTRLTDRCENWDWLVTSLDPATGAVRWSVQHDSGEANDEPRDMALTPDGRTVLATGVTGTGCVHLSDGGAPRSECDTDTTTIAWDADTGARRWITTHDPAGEPGEAPVAMALDPGGRRLAIASSWSIPSTTTQRGALAVTALDVESGRTLWRRGEDLSAAADVAFVAGGERVVVAGIHDRNIAIYLYDREDGNGRAEIIRDGPAGGFDSAWRVAPAPSGGFAVIGTMQTGSGPLDLEAVVMAMDRRAREAWVARLPEIGRPVDVEVRPGGEAAIAVGDGRGVPQHVVAVALRPGPVFAPPRPCGPRARIGSGRVGRRGASVRGRARWAGCDAAARRVEVAVAARAGRRCRHLGRDGRLSGRRPCAERRWLAVRGTQRWVLRTRAPLPRGRYVVTARARAGAVVGRPAARRMRAR